MKAGSPVPRAFSALGSENCLVRNALDVAKPCGDVVLAGMAWNLRDGELV